jgi:integrase
MPPRAATLVIDIRDARLAGGRLKLSARTTSKKVRKAREAALRRLIDLGESEIIDLVRARKLPLSDVTREVDAGTHANLRPTLAGRFVLGVQVDRMLERVPRQSYAGYESCFRGLVESFGASFPMETLTRDAALGWLHAPKRSTGNLPWSPGSRELNRIRCGALWDMVIYAAQEEAEHQDRRSAFRRNPWKDAKPARGTSEAIRPRQAYLQPAQWDRLLLSVLGTRRALLYALCCLAGLRKQEALQLRTGVDVELWDVGGRIRIQPREGANAWKPKTQRSVRDVPVTANLRALIQMHIESGHAGERYLLRSTAGDWPTNPRTADEWVKHDFPAAGLLHGRAGDGLTLHSLRHTFASWLVQMDAPTLKVAKLLGDTVEMVERVYGHLAPTDLIATAGLIDRKLSESREGLFSTASDTEAV